MSEADDARSDILAKLAASRAEIRHILEPAPPFRDGGGSAAADEMTAAPGSSSFPRSRTMRMLLSGRGAGTVGAVLGGLVLARPALVFKLLRMLPVGAVARVLLLRAIAALRSSRPPTPGR